MKTMISRTLAILLVGFMAPPASADDTDSSTQGLFTSPRVDRVELRIHQVFANFDQDELLINGVNFDFKGDPIVTIDGVEDDLVILSADDAEITVELPVLEDGNYRLDVQSGDERKKRAFDSFEFTLGMVGPQGTQGVAGPRGIQGIQGEQGPQGIQGEPGLAGSFDLYTVEDAPTIAGKSLFFASSASVSCRDKNDIAVGGSKSYSAPGGWSGNDGQVVQDPNLKSYHSMTFTCLDLTCPSFDMISLSVKCIDIPY